MKISDLEKINKKIINDSVNLFNISKNFENIQKTTNFILSRKNSKDKKNNNKVGNKSLSLSARVTRSKIHHFFHKEVSGINKNVVNTSRPKIKNNISKILLFNYNR